MSTGKKFVENMESYGLGAMLDELADDQKKVIGGVRQTGKKGKLILELNYTRRGHHDVAVDAKIKATVPRAPLEPVVMYADDKNDLHEENPDQLSTDNVLQLGQGQKEANQV